MKAAGVETSTCVYCGRHIYCVGPPEFQWLHAEGQRKCDIVRYARPDDTRGYQLSI